MQAEEGISPLVHLPVGHDRERPAATLVVHLLDPQITDHKPLTYESPRLHGRDGHP